MKNMKTILAALLFWSVVNGLRADEPIILPTDETYHLVLKKCIEAEKKADPDAFTPGTVLYTAFVSNMDETWKKSPELFKNPCWPGVLITQSKAAIFDANQAVEIKKSEDKIKDLQKEQADLKDQMDQENRRHEARMKESEDQRESFAAKQKDLDNLERQSIATDREALRLDREKQSGDALMELMSGGRPRREHIPLSDEGHQQMEIDELQRKQRQQQFDQMLSK